MNFLIAMHYMIAHVIFKFSIIREDRIAFFLTYHFWCFQMSFLPKGIKKCRWTNFFWSQITDEFSIACAHFQPSLSAHETLIKVTLNIIIIIICFLRIAYAASKIIFKSLLGINFSHTKKKIHSKKEHEFFGS